MTAAEQLRNLLLRHQLSVNRFTNRQALEAVRILERAQRDALSLLARRVRQIEALGLDPGPTTTSRLLSVARELGDLLGKRYKVIGGKLVEDVARFAEVEAEATRRILEQALPGAIAQAGVATVAVQPALLQALTSTHLFGLADRFAGLAVGHQRIFTSYVRLGMVEGQGIAEIVARIASTGMRLARSHISTVVRTVTASVANEARDATFRANAGPGGVVKGVVWLSTLDTRTTIEWCVPRDNLPYTVEGEPIGHGYPWLEGPGRIHDQCRSTSTAILRSWDELGISARELPASTRRAMDGEVPASTTAEQWLRGRNRSELVGMFGPTRADLFKAGKVSVADLVHLDGGLLTLDELAASVGIAL